MTSTRSTNSPRRAGAGVTDRQHRHAATSTRSPAEGITGDGWSMSALVALAGGPADGWWFHLAEWQALWRSAARMAEVHRRGRFDPASWPLLYARSGRTRTHAKNADRIGEEWTWQGPTSVRSVRDLVVLDEAERKAGDQ